MVERSLDQVIIVVGPIIWDRKWAFDVPSCVSSLELPATLTMSVVHKGCGFRIAAVRNDDVSIDWC